MCKLQHICTMSIMVACTHKTIIKIKIESLSGQHGGAFWAETKQRNISNNTVDRLDSLYLNN